MTEGDRWRRRGACRWSAAVAILVLAPLTALASPVVPLQGTTLVSQGYFDLGCTQNQSTDACERGCAFVGERLYCWREPNLAPLAEWVPRPDRASGDFDRPTSLAVEAHSCVADAGGVWCWGPNQHGQLGVGDLVPRVQPTRVAGLPEDIVQIALSPRHTCVRSRSEGIWCWGWNDRGQTGQPVESAALQQTLPQRVPGLPAAVDHIALGDTHSCALVGARVSCWGDNTVGQLGDGTENSSSTPRPVSGLPANVSALDAGWQHNCALVSGGDVWCWGENALSATGVPMTVQLIVRSATRVEGLPGPATELNLAISQSCALVDTRRWCWGLPDRFLEHRFLHVRELRRLDGAPSEWLYGCFQQGGVLRCPGRGVPSEVNAAKRVSLPAGQPVQLAIGGQQFIACARYADGAVACWGHRQTPSGTLPIPPASDLAVGRQHACAATSDGVWCWGDNRHGALGDGSTVSRTGPVRARFGGTRVAAGDGHSCAWSQDNGLRCWGRNDSGQVSGLPTPAPMPEGAAPLGNAAVVALAVGAEHSCATLALSGGAQETRCWGRLPLNATDLATGVVDFSPRVVPAGAPLPGESAPQLRAAGYTACVGDRCYGLNVLPPDRGEERVGALFAPPTGAATRAIALGASLACVQGHGTDIRCVPLIGPVCAFDQRRGLLSPGCRAWEAEVPESLRGWLPVAGLPDIPRGLAIGERYACAIFARDVWCWGDIYFDLSPPGLSPIYRAGAIEPAPTVGVTLNPARACPAYLVSSVTLLDPNDPLAAGNWGLDLLLGSGGGNLHGGLNFGGFGSTAGAGVPGYAAFSIQNPLGPGQLVTLDLAGDGGEFMLTVESTLPPSTVRTLELREQLTLGAVAQRRSLTLANGFHIVGLQPLQGTRLFLAAIGTTQTNGSPAAFLGGAVVGGWLEGTQSGFAAVCTADANSVLLHTQARSTRSADGAGDLRLQLFEGQTGEQLYDSAD